MAFHRPVPVLACLIVSGLVAAPPQVVARLKADVVGLCGPDMKGRGNGQAGLDKAAVYAVKAFEKIGLKAIRQDVPYQTLQRDRLEVVLTVDGKERPLVAGKDVDIFDGPVSLKQAASPILYVGHGFTHASHDDLAGLDLKGRIVVVDPIRGSNPTYGTVPVEEMAPTKVIKNLSSRGAALVLMTQPMVGPVRLGPFPFPSECPVGVFFKGALGEKVDQALAEARKKLAEGSVASQELPVSMACHIEQKPAPQALPNVVATVQGTDPTLKAEHIVVGAHLDHVGASGDTVFTGADDNASGCAGVLEIARSFAAKPPKRSVTFILFGGEEAGLLGSRHWVKQPTIPLTQVKAMLNLDCIGRFDAGKQDLGLTGLGWSPDALALAKKIAPTNLKVSTDRGSTPFAYMSDHASFAAARIPAVFFFTGVHADLHKPSDTPERLNLEAMADITLFAESLARQQADAAAPLTFTPRPSLGMRAAQPGGLTIKTVIPGSLCASLNLQPGDTVTQIAETPIATKVELDRAMDGLVPGQTVTLRWTREGKTMEGSGVLTEAK